MKRWLSLLIVLLLTLSLLSGCKTAPQEAEGAVADNWIGVETGGGEEDPEKEPSDKEEAPEKEPSEGNSQKDPAEENTAPDDKKDPAADASADNGEDPADGDGENPGTTVPDEGATQDPEGEEALPPITKEQSGTAITLLAQNVKHDGVQLAVRGDGRGNALYNRLSRFRTLLQTHDPDVIFFQEARVGTLQFFTEEDPYISQTYTTHWKWRWDELGPYEGGHQAEPLMYKTVKYQCLDSGFFWLSDTPNRPSKCYDVKADYGNIASWAVLKDKETGVEFYVCSAHSPDPTDGGGLAAYKSMEQFFEELRDLGDGGYGFVGGDLNITYRSDAYNAIWDWDTIVDLRDMAQNMNADGLCDLGGINGSIDRGFEEDTFDSNPGNGRQIDHILAKLHPRMAVDYWGFDYTRYTADGVQEGHISDHYGLVCKVRIDTEVDYSRYQKQYEG